jgi:hypothetical protein
MAYDSSSAPPDHSASRHKRPVTQTGDGRGIAHDTAYASMSLRFFSSFASTATAAASVALLFASACAGVGCSSTTDSAAGTDAGSSIDGSSHSDGATADAGSDSDGDSHDASTTSDASAGDGGGACPRAPTSGLPTGTGTVTGTLQGRTQNVVDVDARIARPGNVGAWELWVELGDFSNACGYDSARLSKASSQSVVLVIQSSSTAAASPFTATTYTSQGLGQSDGGSFSYNISVISDLPGTQCKGSSARSSAQGTITVTTAGPTRVVGSYDLHLAGGDHLTGTFDAPVCNPIDPLAPACCVP